jgi:hypothetical protein
MDQLNHLGWVVHRAYEVGGVQFGVRTNSQGFGDWLDDVFSEWRISEEDVAPYYSVLVADGDDGQVGKRYHILYEESRALLKTLDLRQVGEGLVAQFEQVATTDRDDAVYLNSGLVTYGDVVALVPPILSPYLSTTGHRALDRAGLRLPIANFVAVGQGSGRVVPVTPRINVGPSALEALDAISPAGPRVSHVETNGPVAVDVVCFLGLQDEPVLPSSPGNSLYLLSTRILNLEQVGGEGLRSVARLVDLARGVEIRSTGVKETLASLLQALSA